MCEMRNALIGSKGRLDSAEEKISKLEDITIETVQNEIRWEEKNFEHEQSISEVWDNFKQPCNWIRDPHCERKTTRARLSRVRGLMVVQSCQSLGQPGRKHWVEYACQSVLSDLRNLTLLTHQGSPGRVWSCLRDLSAAEGALRQAWIWRGPSPWTHCFWSTSHFLKWDLKANLQINHKGPGLPSQTAQVQVLTLPLPVRS